MPATTRRTTKLKHANVGELLESLGVPASRVRLHPPPGRATKRDLLKLDVAGERLYELVERTLVEKAMGFKEGHLALELAFHFRLYLSRNDAGFLGGPDSFIELIPNLIRSPDISFISWDRCPERTVPERPFSPLIPNLAVEILSTSNTKAEMLRKRGEYFRAGVEAVWEIQPADRTAVAYAGPTDGVVLKSTGQLDGGSILPGFSLPLATLFASLKPLPRGK